jgi:hypothetical protein
LVSEDLSRGVGTKGTAPAATNVQVWLICSDQVECTAIDRLKTDSIEFQPTYKFQGVAGQREQPFPGPSRCNAQLVEVPDNIGLGFDCQVHGPAQASETDRSEAIRFGA